jgi:hypothetical protein
MRQGKILNGYIRDGTTGTQAQATTLLTNNNKQLYELDKYLESKDNRPSDMYFKIKNMYDLDDVKMQVYYDLLDLRKEREEIMDTDHNEEFKNTTRKIKPKKIYICGCVFGLVICVIAIIIIIKSKTPEIEKIL